MAGQRLPTPCSKSARTFPPRRSGPCCPGQVSQSIRGQLAIVHPEKKLVGRAVTAQFMPYRPDVTGSPRRSALARGLGRNNNQRVIDSLQPGDVLVVDLFGKIEGGTFVGDNSRPRSTPRPRPAVLWWTAPCAIWREFIRSIWPFTFVACIPRQSPATL